MDEESFRQLNERIAVVLRSYPDGLSFNELLPNGDGELARSPEPKRPASGLGLCTACSCRLQERLCREEGEGERRKEQW